jgi:hypothetical protein
MVQSLLERQYDALMVSIPSNNSFRDASFVIIARLGENGLWMS